MSKTTFIYGLFCPVSGELRYIGKSNNPTIRLRRHNRSKPGTTHKACWIASLAAIGQQPELAILDEVSESEWQETEQFYIAYFRYIGANLTNIRAGGDGGATEEQIRKLASLNKGRPLSPERRAKIAAANTGRKMPIEGVEKSASTRRGVKRSPEFAAAQKARFDALSPEEKARRLNRGGPIKSQETRQKMSAAKKGKTTSDKHKAALSIAMKNVWAKRKAFAQET